MLYHIGIAFVIISAIAHLGFAIMEMALWKSPRVHTRLGYTQAEADKVAPIVLNAGLYNSFFAAGLSWWLIGTLWPDAGLSAPGTSVLMFLLGCAVLAGVIGAATLSRKTLVLQTLPAAVALALIVSSR